MSSPAPIPSASVMLLRDAPLRVLMIRRHEKSSFVPNAWVFPGGAADDVDRGLATESGDASTVGAMKVTAVRELFEETGIWMGGALPDAENKRRRLLAGTLTMRQLVAESPVDFTQLVWTSHWITPVGVPKRFETWFFLAVAPPDAVATVQQEEAVDVTWIAPQDALARNAAGELEMVFPTIRNLEALGGHQTAASLLDSRSGADIPVMQPRIVVENGVKKIVLP